MSDTVCTESELISNCTDICYKEVDIEASKPASSTPLRYDTVPGGNKVYLFVLREN